MDIEGPELKKRSLKARKSLSHCTLCPRRCGVNRIKGAAGFCEAGPGTKVYSYRKYSGEEPAISGTRGSGVIFFSNCTMKCSYCQNYRFSQLGEGYTVTPQTLCKIMLWLEKSGCHNINLVTPSHYLPDILESLSLAKKKSLSVPIVYNTSGYECAETLKLLDGVVDIYLTDMRYSDNKLSRVYSQTEDYVNISRLSAHIMRGQVGDLIIDKEGIARKGMIVRHLVMPGLLSNTEGVLKYIAEKISKEIYISLMSQYMPLYKAKEHPEISRPITRDEYATARSLLDKYGINNGWVQQDFTYPERDSC